MKRRAFILLLAIAIGTANLAGSAPVYAAQEEDIQVIEEAGQEDSANQASEMEQDNASPEEDTHTGEEDDEQRSIEAAGTNDSFNEYDNSDKDISEKSNSESNPEMDDEYDMAESDILLNEEINASEDNENDMADESEDALAEADEVINSGVCGENAVWMVTGSDRNLTLTISGNGDMYDYTKKGAPWYSLTSSIKKGVVEQGITGIGAYTFYGCSSMTEVIIPDSVTRIGEWGFFSCSALTDVYIPEGVTVISDTLFSGCDSLREIAIPNSVTCIEENAFSGCDSLTEIIIPENVTEIGYAAFSTCTGLRSIKIPEGVTKIEGYVFEGCEKLKDITIPEGVTSIDHSAFSGCRSLTSLEIPDQVFSIGPGAFSDCSSLTAIVIPDGVTCIREESFSNCGSLTKVTLPAHLESIEEYAFSWCDSLKEIKIPDSVTKIYGYAFYNCSDLTGLQLPEGVIFIGSNAFESCSSLTEVILPNSIEELEGQIFDNCGDSCVIVTKNAKVIDYCKSCGYKYYDKNAPSIEKLESFNGSDIRVTIDEKENATGYQIKYADNSAMAGAKTVTIKGGTLSKVITGLKDAKTYYVKVQGYQDIGGRSYWSSWSLASSIKVTQKPYTTKIAKLTTYIGSHIKVDWSKTAGATGYHIKYADNSSMNNAREVIVNGNKTFTKTLTGLKNGKTYYVRIQTIRKAAGRTYWSSWSPVQTITVNQTPYGSSVSKLTNLTGKKMKITWAKAPSGTGYHIQYAANSNMTGAKDIMVNNRETLSKTITGLTKGKTYYVRIQVFRKISGKTYWSSWSKVKSIRITK